MSQVEQYEKCAYRFYLQRIERVVPRPAAWSFHGTAFHTAAEEFEKSFRTMSEEEAVQVFSDKYSALVNKALDKESDLSKWLSVGREAGEDIENRYVVGQEQVRRYVQWSNEHQPDIWIDDEGWNGHDVSDAPLSPTVGLELYFKVEIGGVLVQGYIDQVLREPDYYGRVRDLKTGSTKSKFQLETYKIGMEKMYGLKINKGDWYLAKNHGLSKPVDLSKVKEDEVGERYATMDAGVKAGNFPPNPGFDCRFCDVSHACRFSRAES